MKLLHLAAVCIGLAISGCEFGEVDAQTETNSKDGSHMESLQSAQSLQNKIPPIDAAISGATETATFALG